MTRHYISKFTHLIPVRVFAPLAVMLGLLAGSISAQTLDVGPSSVTTNFTSGTNVYTAINIGTAGSGNTLGISGPGTLITDGGASGAPTWYLGTGGSNNSLVISNGGSLNFYQSRMGGGASGNGNSLTVTGSNSLLKLTLPGWSSLSMIVAGSSNSILVADGGVLSGGADRFRFGSEGGNNSFVVTGTGSKVTNFEVLDVGGGSFSLNNSLRVSSNGAVSVANLHVGYNGQATGNSLTVDSGGSVNVANALILSYSSSTSNNAILVSGTNSTLSAAANWLGSAGGGNLATITNGGTLRGGYDSIGLGATSSNNSVLVTGVGSLWTCWGALNVGNDGAGNLLTIANGGMMNDPDGTLGNAATSSNNSVLVTGAGSLWANSGNLLVGNNGAGNLLTITNGGTVRDGNGTLGNAGTSSSNSVLVTGTGSLWTNSGYILVGASGSGNSLRIADGGRVFSANGYVAGTSSSNNSVIVDGGLWSVANQLEIGSQGSLNSLTITNGGTVKNANGFLGFSATSSNNSVLATGSSSIWTNSGYVLIGKSGSGNSLTIADGGRVFSANGYVAGTSSSNNSVIVDGGLWNVANQLEIGSQGSLNSLTITNGGTVKNANGFLGFSATSSNNSALVAGSSSIWTNSGNLVVGNAGSGNSLTISNGGRVSSAGGTIGVVSGSLNNSVLVTGTGSTWSNSGSLTVGAAGLGSALTIGSGGSVAAADLKIAAANGSGGTVNIGALGGSDTGVQLNVSSVEFGLGAGALNFNQADTFVFSGPIRGGASGVLAQRGSGTTTLTGTNTYSGDTIVSGGTLVVGSAGVLGGGQYAGNVDLSSASGKLVIDTTQNQGLSGAISGSGSLVKTSTGTLTVTGADNAYTGTTTIGGGTLVLNGTHTGGGAYTVQSGGTLKGDGRTTAAVTVDSGGNITPGNSPGELTIGDFTLNGTLNIAIDGAHNSLLTVVGNADIAGGTVSFTTGAAATEDVYVFLTATGTLNSPFASINGLAPTDPLGAAGYQLFYDTNDGIAFLKLSSVTNVVEAIFHGPNAVIGSGTTNFNVYVYNGGSTPLTASAVGDGVDSFGSTASTNIAANNGDELSNLTFSNGSGTFGTNTAVFNAVLNGTTNPTTFDVVVYDHASNVVTGTNLNFRPVHAGAGIVTSTNSVTVSNKNDSFRIAMGVTNDNTNVGIAIDSVSGLAQGGSADLFGTLDTSAMAPGRFTNTANLISFDDSALNGASTNLGMVGVQITGYVYTGQGVWTGNGGDWQDFADWQELGGTPGLDGALSVNDTAFFGAAGNGPVTLNTDAELLSVTFSNATTPYVLSGTGTLKLTASGADPAAINTLAGGHTISNAVAPGSDLVLSNASGSSLTLAGAVSGVSGLVKTGAGTTMLTASNTYTGATSVAGGDLVVNGSIADSATTVLSGGTLSGTGTVGELTIENGGTVSPGFEGPGALNINGDVSLLGGGNYNWQIHDTALPAGTGWDLLTSTGVLDLSSLTSANKFNLNLWSLSGIAPEVSGNTLTFDNTQNYTWTILTAAGGINAFSADKFNINIGATNGAGGFLNGLGGGAFSLLTSGNNLNLVFTAAGAAVPEPGTWAAAALLAGSAAFMRWRKRRSVGDDLED